MPEESVTILAILKDQISGPAANIGRAFDGIQSSVSKIQAGLAPLTGRLAQVVSGFVSISAGRKALAVAEENIKAQTRLLAALENNEEAYARIEKVVNQLGEVTTFDNTSYEKAAATMLGMGSASLDLTRNLTIAADVASQLGIPLESAAMSIAQIENGITPRNLIRSVPELRKLQQAGELAAKGVSMLEQKFKGAAAAMAATPFGQIAIAANKMENQFARIGEILAPMKAKVMDGLARGVEQLANSMAGPEFQMFGDKIAQGAEFAMKNVDKLAIAILSVQAATMFADMIIRLKLLGIGIAGIVSSFALWAGIGLIIAGVTMAIADLTGQSDNLRKGLSDAGETVKEAWNFRISGILDESDFLDTVKMTLAQMWTALKGYVFGPIESFFKALYGTVEGFLGWAWKSADYYISMLIESALNGLAKIFDKIPGLGSQAEGLRAGAEQVGSGKDAAKLAADEYKAEMLGSFPNMLKDIKANIADAEASLAEYIAGKEQGVLDRITARLKKVTDARNSEQDKKHKDWVKEQKRLAEEITALSEERITVAANENDEAKERRRQLEIKDLEEQLKAEKITSAAYVAKREELERAPLEKKLAEKQALIAETQKLLDLEQAATQGEKVGKGKVKEILDKLLKTEKERQDIVLKLEELEYSITEQKRQQADYALGQMSSEINLQQSLAGRAQDMLAKGKISLSYYRTLIQQQNAAYDAAREKTIKDLQGLGLSEEDLKKKMTELELQAPEREDVESWAAFGNGLKGSFTTAAEGARDLQKAGMEAGQNLYSLFTNQLSGAITDFATGAKDAKTAFLDMSRAIISAVIQMIAQLLVMQMVMSTVSLFGGAFGGFMANGGGQVPVRRNSGGGIGGEVPGPRVSRDIVPAILTPGEYVVREPAVRHYGTWLLQAINEMILPRSAFSGMLSGRFTSRAMSTVAGGMAKGGEAKAGGRQQSQTPVPAFVLASEESMERLLAGGGTALQRYMGTHRSEIKAALGVG